MNRLKKYLGGLAAASVLFCASETSRYDPQNMAGRQQEISKGGEAMLEKYYRGYRDNQTSKVPERRNPYGSFGDELTAPMALGIFLLMEKIKRRRKRR